MVEAITYYRLFTNIEQIDYIKELEVTNEINVHATLKLTGILKNSNGKEFAFDIKNNEPIQVSYFLDDLQYGLFCGTITKVKVVFFNDVYAVEIEAKSNTYLLDIYKKSQSFQDINMTAHEVIQRVISDYTNINVDIQIPNVPIGQLIVQYNETDYEFLKRFASMYNQGILANIYLSMTSFSIGIGERKAKSIDFEKFTIYKDIEKYQYMKANFIPSVTELDYIIHEILSYYIFHLGENVLFNSNNFYIGKAEYKLVENLIECTYSVQLKSGLMQKRLYNHRLIGISILGNVLLPQRDQLKVHLRIDKNQDLPTAYLFPYSTISASSDGSGWYNMPEIGDEVRVYFPTKDEAEAFSISSASAYVPQNVSETDRMSNPDVKYIRTQANKEVKFTPEGIFISSDDTQAKINLLKNGDVFIFGQNSIVMTAVEKITMQAEKEVLILAKESIKFECEKNGSIELDIEGNTTIKGFKVKSN